MAPAKRILVIDDEFSIRLTLRCAFSCRSCEVSEAGCGREALDLLTKETYDLIFLDINLPDVSGLQVLQTMRQRQIDTPVVAITAHAEPVLEDALDQLECFGVLPKPFTPSELRIAAARATREV
jgi:CheY-like chemotaxis protein